MLLKFMKLIISNTNPNKNRALLLMTGRFQGHEERKSGAEGQS